MKLAWITDIHLNFIDLDASTNFVEASLTVTEMLLSLASTVADILSEKGVRFKISDDHWGLKVAIKAVLPMVRWQRCQFRMACNAQDWAPKKTLKKEIGQAMRSIFSCSDIKTALEM